MSIQTKRTRQLKHLAITNLGNKCGKCKFSDLRALQIDHINGGGNQSKLRVRNATYYTNVINNLAKFQLLCANCNWIKRHENHEFRQEVFRPAKCHSKERHHAKGLCYNCYHKISSPSTKKLTHSSTTTYRNLRNKVLDKLGKRCSICGFDNVTALHIDHIRGKGKQDLKTKNYVTFLRDVLNDATTTKYQLLCANCNFIKAVKLKEVPQIKNVRAKCHPDKPHCAKGLCKKCYDDNYHKYRKLDKAKLSHSNSL